jgi:outer membrane protein assembly factor BamA
VTRWREASLAAGFLCLLSAGVTRPAAAQDAACDAGGVEVRTLRFTGNNVFASDSLSLWVATTPSSWPRRVFRFFGTRHCIDPVTLTADSLRLLILYHRHGYSQAAVATEVRNVGPREVSVTFRVSEGAPLLIDSLAINGLDSIPTRDRLIRGLVLHSGGPFDRFLIEAARDTMVRRMHNSGYPNAEVFLSYNTDTAKRRATVEFNASPGPLAHVGSIAIKVTPREKGRSQSISDAKVRQVLGIKPGDLYRERSLEAAKRSLFLTDAYRSVDVSLDTLRKPGPADSVVKINVSLAETFMHSANAGVGWGILDCFRVQGHYSDQSFLADLRRLDLNMRVSKIGIADPLKGAESLCNQATRDPYSTQELNYYFGATIRQSALFGVNNLPTLTVYSELRSEYLVYKRTTPIGTLATVNLAPTRRLPVTLSYSLEYGRTNAQPALFCAVFNQCDAQAQELLQTKRRFAVASAQITRNRLNDQLNPTSGTVLHVEARHASTAILSDPIFQLNKLTTDASWFTALGRNVLSARLRAGTVFGKRLSFSDSIPFIPLQERLYAGGATSVRGYPQNELGPLVYTSERYDTVSRGGQIFYETPTGAAPRRVVPSGGNTEVVGNLELLTPSPFGPDWAQLALFVDAGQVWTRGTGGVDQGFANLKITPGIGVRLLTFIGPIRFDIGYNPYQRPAGPVYFDFTNLANVNASTVLPLYCVSPGNTLPITLPEAGSNAPPTQAKGSCPPSFSPNPRTSFRDRLQFQFSIGQSF